MCSAPLIALIQSEKRKLKLLFYQTKKKLS